MAAVLVVEDTLEHQIQIKSCIDRKLEVVVCDSYHSALETAQKNRFDLIILDVHLPSGSGFELCSEIRNHTINSESPILFVTAKSSIMDKVMGFTVGANDYIVKPFDSRELKVRIDSKLRTLKSNGLGDLSIGNLRIYVARYKAVRVDENREEELPLTHQEFRLLLYFATHQNMVLSRSQVLRNAWGENIAVTERTIDRHVSTLRSKIRGCRVAIEPVYRTGYLCKVL